ncbi:MAG: hypothetical protein PHN49_08090, partial [Candidatus Omnitrophica bacterium]|nr:hypothetical protein [Candidatus Omnitrophota bacterium]
EEYGDPVLAGDVDNDGLSEIDFKVLRRIVNGTELAYRRAVALKDQIVAEHAITVPSGSITSMEELKILADRIQALYEDLNTQLGALAGTFEVEEAFKQGILDEVNAVVMGVYDGYINQIRLVLERDPNPMDTIAAEHNIVYPAGEIVMFDSLLDLIARVDAQNMDMKNQIDALCGTEGPTPNLFANIRWMLESRQRSINAGAEYDLIAALINHPTEINAIIEQHNIVFPSGPVSVEQAIDLVAQVDQLRSDLEMAMRELLSHIKGLGVSETLVNRVREILQTVTNGGWYWNSDYDGRYASGSLTGAYPAVLQNLNSVLRGGQIEFSVDGIGTVVLSANDLNVLTDNLPREISTLIRFPGIAAAMTAEQLAAFEKMQSETLRQRIRFDDENIGETPDQLSTVGIRLQFMQLVLEVFGERIVRDGSVNIDAFRRAILLDENLEQVYAQAQNVILSDIDYLNRVIENPPQAMTLAFYDELNRIIQDSNGKVTDILKPALDQVIYDAREMVIGMIQNDFNQLLNTIDAVTQRAIIQVTIDGQAYSVNARDVMARIQEIMPRLAISQAPYNYGASYGQYSKDQYDRLQGLSAELLQSIQSPYEHNYSRQLRFDGREPYFGRDMLQPMADEEVWYRLLPQVLEGFGTAIVGTDGVISLDRIEDKLLEGVYAPVPKGQTLLGAFTNMLNDVINATIARLNALDYSKWEDRVLAEKLVFEAIAAVQSGAQPFIQELNGTETNKLASIANGYDQANFNGLWSLLDNKLWSTPVQTVVLSDGSVLNINLSDIKNIPGFPGSRTYDTELFPGITDSDFTGSDNRQRSQITIQKGVTDVPVVYNSWIDQDKFIVSLLKRHYDGRGQIPELYSGKLFTQNADGSLTLNVEIFRRLIKGVDLLHKQILDQVTLWTAEELQKLEAFKAVPMTVDAIRAIYGEVSAFRAKVLEYMNGLTARHEKEDVIEMEEAVSAVYKKTVDAMIQYVRDHQLVTVINGAEVEIPWAELTQRMLAVIGERFPGEDIGAHHFASFYGVTIEDLRSYNKLEEFLGMQIIALPRNSQYVEILSKLSEIGMMELSEKLIQRYAEDGILVNGAVDVDTLMDLIADPEVAMQKTRERTDEIIAPVEEYLFGLEFPLTNKTLQEMADAFNKMKLELVNVINGCVTGFSQEMFDEIQDYVESMYQYLAATRNELLAQQPIEITAADGSQFAIDLTELEPAAVDEIMILLLNPRPEEPAEPYLPVYYDTYELQLDKSVVYRDIEEVALVSSIDMRIDTAYRIDDIAKTDLIARIWYPLPGKIDPKDTLTEFGFYQLLVKLAEKYGSFVVDEDGAFSVAKFLRELGRTDLERAQERFLALQNEALAELQLRVPQADGGEITLEDVLGIHGYLDEARQRFLSVLNRFMNSDDPYAVIAAGNNAWSAVMAEYELRVFSKNILMTVDGQTVSIEGRVLASIIREEYGRGNTELINQYKEGGETQSQYSDYRTLYQQYYWDYRMAKESEAYYDDPNDVENQNSRYPFNLGQLMSLPGISRNDLAGLDVESKDQVRLTLTNAKELLKGLLNMRVFAPGSSVQTIGATKQMAETNAYDSVSMSDVVELKSMLWYPYPRPKVLDLSDRDLMFRVLPALVKDYAARIVVGGKVDAAKLRQLLSEAAITKQVTQTVQNDLAASFGFDPNRLAELIKEGLVQILVDVVSRSAKVIIDPSVKLEDLVNGAVRLVNPLGLGKLPNEINYKYEKDAMQLMIACTRWYCPPSPNPTYHLVSATFELENDPSDGRVILGRSTYDLSYLPEPEPKMLENGEIWIKELLLQGDNKLRSVKVTLHQDVVCIQAPCPDLSRVVSEIRYRYVDNGEVIAQIVNSPGGVRAGTEQKVYMVPLADGKLHIQKIEDVRSGEVVATGEFNYVVAQTFACQPDGKGGCIAPVFLRSIVRRAADGRLLSEITDIQRADFLDINGDGKIDGNDIAEDFNRDGMIDRNDMGWMQEVYQARVSVDGFVQLVRFNTWEELLALAKSLESDQNLYVMKKMVMRNLMDTFGLSYEELAGLIDSMEIRRENLSVTVRFKQGKMGGARQINVLGDDKMPATVVYQLKQKEWLVYKTSDIEYAEAVREELWSPVRRPIIRPFPLPLNRYELVSAQVRWDESSFVHLNAGVQFLGNRISEILWERKHDGISCEPAGEYCLDNYQGGLIELLYREVYSYENDSIKISRGPAWILAEYPEVIIRYPVTEGDTIPDPLVTLPDIVRPSPAPLASVFFTITLERMADGKHHIKLLEEYSNQNRKFPVSTTTFDYETLMADCAPGVVECVNTPPVVILNGMRRVAGMNSEWLSTTSINMNEHKALVDVGDGEGYPLAFTNLENLLDQVRKLEEKRALFVHIRRLALSHLAGVYGFSAEELELWIKEGRVKLDIRAGHEIRAIFGFDASLEGLRLSGSKVDALGSGFTIPSTMVLSIWDGDVRGLSLVYQQESWDDTAAALISQGWKRDELRVKSATVAYDKELPGLGYTYILAEYDVGANRLEHVDRFNFYSAGPEVKCAEGEKCLSTLVKTVEIRSPGSPCWENVCTNVFIWPYLRAVITYPAVNGNGVTKRVVEYATPGQLEPADDVPAGAIWRISEYGTNKSGQETLLAVSEFVYDHWAVGMPCEVGPDGSSKCPEAPHYLKEIIRKDPDGKLLSTVMNFKDTPVIDVTAEARIILPNGINKFVKYQTLEELLALAKNFEDVNLPTVILVPPIKFGTGTVLVYNKAGKLWVKVQTKVWDYGKNPPKQVERTLQELEIVSYSRTTSQLIVETADHKAITFNLKPGTYVMTGFVESPAYGGELLRKISTVKIIGTTLGTISETVERQNEEGVYMWVGRTTRTFNRTTGKKVSEVVAQRAENGKTLTARFV